MAKTKLPSFKTIKYESREAWERDRKGRATGSRVKDLISRSGPTKEMIVSELIRLGVEFKKSALKDELESLLTPESAKMLRRQLPKKAGFWQIAAELIAKDAGDEHPMERGTQLEEEAIALFAERTGKIVTNDLIMWQREDVDAISISPDGVVVGEKAAVESKSLASWKHIRAFETKQIPDEYQEQAMQYFVVRQDLETLYFVFYDPRIPGERQLFWLELQRKDYEAVIAEYDRIQQEDLEEIYEIVNDWTE